jgi:hypothetical protein
LGADRAGQHPSGAAESAAFLSLLESLREDPAVQIVRFSSALNERAI